MKVLIVCILGSLLVSIVFAPPRETAGMPLLLLMTGRDASPSTQEDASEDILQRKVPGDELEFLRTTDVFYASLGRTRVPGGMVRLVDCEEDTLLQSWRPLDSPLRQVLHTMVAKDPRYTWKIQDGIVNLLPATGEPALLKTRLNEFHVEDISSAREALSWLLALREVKKRMRDLHLKPGIAIIVGGSGLNPPKFSVKQTGGTLHQALNAIAHAQGSAIWEYIEIHCDGKNEVVIRF
jgi:hypothetical protein